MAQKPYIKLEGSGTLRIGGEWTVDYAAPIAKGIEKIDKEPETIDASALARLDTAGAWLLKLLKGKTGKPIEGLAPQYAALFRLIEPLESPHPPAEPYKGPLEKFLERTGRTTFNAWEEVVHLLSFIGEAAITLKHVLGPKGTGRWMTVIRHIQQSGIEAVPIVMLIAFLISVVLAYQGAYQLRRFGAEIFTVNLVAVSVLREMGVLLSAIMIAGRSGSAFTAEIGMMKVNEELDAMRTIGLNPFEILVLPRILALTISLPFLTFIADIMGLLGGAVVSYFKLNITLFQFFAQCRQAVDLSDFWVGIIKAPVFAFFIAIVGCIRGLQAEGSAESVGRLTTVSVVESIFIVLLLDAVFSILFAQLGV